MHISREPSGNYRCHVRRKIDGKSAKKSATFSSRREAQVWGLSIETSLDSTALPLVHAFDLYLTEKIEPEQRDKHTETAIVGHRKRIGKLRQIQNDLRYYTVESFTPTEAHAYKEKRLRMVSPATARKDLYVIRALFEWLIKEKMIVDVENPIAKIKLPPSGKRRRRIHSENERWHIITALPPEDALIYELLWETACRLSEIIYLRAEWVLVEGDIGFIDLPAEYTKQDEAREVPLSSRAREILSTLTAMKPKGRLFKVKYDTFRQRYMRTVKQLGFEDLRIHDLRRTAISRYADRMSAYELKRLSGHTSYNALDRYVNLHRSTSIFKRLD